MARALIGVLGLFIFLSGLALGAYLLNGRFQASALDGEETRYGSIGTEGLLPCSWQVDPPDSVMAEDKSQAIVVQVNNPLDTDCESVVSLLAPNFDLSPSKEEQKITVPAQGKGSISWIVAPRKTGTFKIAVSDALNTRIFGMTVTNVFGLSATQAQLLSAAGSLFGPMFTLPWWLEKLRQRREKQATKGAS